MKKLCLFLCIVMLFGMVSCGKKVEKGGDDGVRVIERSDGSDKNVPVSLFKSYKTSVGADSVYPDKTGKLTDGERASGPAAYTNPVFAGYYSSNVDIDVDLGNDGEGLWYFALSYLSTDEAGIKPPKSVSVLISDDGMNFKKIGDCTLGDFERNTAKTAELTLEKPVDARYVRFSAVRAGAWLFFDELTVLSEMGAKTTGRENPAEIAYRESDASRPAISIEKLESGLTYDAKNGTETVSIGKNCTVVSAGYDPKALNTPGSLTDGLDTGAPRSEKVWVGCKADEGVTFTIDLGKNYDALCNFTLYTCAVRAENVRLPAYVDFYTGNDENDLVFAGRVYSPASESVLTYGYTVAFGKCLSARFVRAVLPADAGKFYRAEEFSVLNNKKVAVEPLTGWQKPNENLLGGAKDIVLLYFKENQKVTRDSLLPYVGYLDENGKIVDKMFSGFLYLPSTSPLPVSGERADGGKTVKGDWDALFSQMFDYENEGVNALDAVAKEVGEATGDPSYRANFYIAFPNLDPAVRDFGDVDGEGITEGLSKTEDCQKVVSWYVGRVQAEIEKRGLSHISLAGCYWFSESCDGVYRTLLPKLADTVHENDLQFFWIPYYRASGYSKWKSFGFDAACMQPNYAFKLTVPESRLYDNAELVSKYGMCFEMECNSSLFASDAFYRKFMNYMKYGVVYGYKDAINMYYQDVSVFRTCCYSDDKRLRAVYDDLYLYMNDRLDLFAEPAVEARFETGVNESFMGTLAFDGIPEGADFVLTSSPSHGSVSLEPNGNFTYYPENGYRGEDSFSYALTRGFENGECAQIDVAIR